MSAFYAIKILDSISEKIVGELMTATPTEILTLIGKGFKVIDISNGEEITTESVSPMIGVSESIIMG